jgi:hypothetical protein
MLNMGTGEEKQQGACEIFGGAVMLSWEWARDSRCRNLHQGCQGQSISEFNRCSEAPVMTASIGNPLF